MANKKISELERATEINQDMLFAVETDDQTYSVSLSQLKALIGGASLPLGLLLHAIGEIDDPAFAWLNGAQLPKANYLEFYNEVVAKVAVGKWVATDQATYDAEVAEYDQCGAFVITPDYVVLPRITRFLGSAITLEEIGKTWQDQMQRLTGTWSGGPDGSNGPLLSSVTTGIIKRGDATSGYNANFIGGKSSYKFEIDSAEVARSGVDGTANDTSSGKDETWPTHTKYPYYIVVSKESSAPTQPEKGGGLELFDKVYRNSYSTSVGKKLAGTLVPSMHTSAYTKLKAEYDSGIDSKHLSPTYSNTTTIISDDYIASGFTANSLSSKISFNPGTKPWKIITKFKLNALPVTNVMSLFGSATNCRTPGLHVGNGGTLNSGLSENGTSWSINGQEWSAGIQVGIDYFASLEFTGNQYLVKLGNTEHSMSTIGTVDSSTPVFQGAESIFVLGSTAGNAVYNLNGTLDLKETKVFIDGIDVSAFMIDVSYKKTSTGKRIADISQKDLVDKAFDYDKSTFYVLDTSNQNFWLPKDKRRTLLKSTNNYDLYSDAWCKQRGLILDRDNATTKLFVPYLDTDYPVFLTINSVNTGAADISPKIRSKALDSFVCYWDVGESANWESESYADPSAIMDVELDLEYYYVGDDIDDPALINTQAVVDQVYENKSAIANKLDNVSLWSPDDLVSIRNAISDLDWTQKTPIIPSGSSNATYTALADGMLFGAYINSEVSNLAYNGIILLPGTGSDSTASVYTPFRMKKGDTMYARFFQGSFFVPFKTQGGENNKVLGINFYGTFGTYEELLTASSSILNSTNAKGRWALVGDDVGGYTRYFTAPTDNNFSTFEWRSGGVDNFVDAVRLASPSSDFYDMTLGLSGAEYVIEYDGILSFRRASTAVNQSGSIIDVLSSRVLASGQSITNGQILQLTTEVYKGQRIQIDYTLAGAISEFSIRKKFGSK